jgi:hypothetical protein
MARAELAEEIDRIQRLVECRSSDAPRPIGLAAAAAALDPLPGGGAVSRGRCGCDDALGVRRFRHQMWCGYWVRRPQAAGGQPGRQRQLLGGLRDLEGYQAKADTVTAAGNQPAA